MKIYDCITFFEEEFLFDLRLKILNKYVDYFVVCESIYSHNGEKKGQLFNPDLYKEYKSKIIHLILDEFPNNSSRWQRQDFQRDFIINAIKNADEDDLILFSDSDEIPDPEKITKLNFKKKFFLFEQKHFCYKFNVINSTEYLWEGTRGCKKKYLSSFNWLRTKVKKKNLHYPFWRIDKEKNIELVTNGGWHFSYFLSPTQIAKKINSSPHEEFINEENLNLQKIEEKIASLSDPLGREKILKKISDREILPNEVKSNPDLYSKWFI
tara:strand:+ start:2332 stop:3132 length:801 start_codon:yes stop_codon:yes gene_type:complete